MFQNLSFSWTQLSSESWEPQRASTMALHSCILSDFWLNMSVGPLPKSGPRTLHLEKFWLLSSSVGWQPERLSVRMPESAQMLK